MSGWLTKRKNNRTRKLPKWMIDLKCDEAFVVTVPTLKAFAAAKIIDSNIPLEGVDKFIFKRAAAEQPVNLICEDWSRESFSLRTEIKHADTVVDWCWKKNIEHCYAYQGYDVVHKSLVKNFPNERKLASCKRRLFD